MKSPTAKSLSPPHRATPRRVGRSPSRFGAGAGGRGGAPGAQVVLPLLQAAPAGIHEEVADGGELQAQLLGDGDLHFFGGALVLLEDGKKCSALEVGENQAGFLLGVVPLFVRLLLFALAGWGKGGQRQRESERQEARGCPQSLAATPGTDTGGSKLSPLAGPAGPVGHSTTPEPRGTTPVFAPTAQRPAFSDRILDGH